MAILKSKVLTYEFGLDEMKALIASDLKVHVDRIDVTYVIQEVGGDHMDRFRGTDQVTKVRVTVKDAV
jgi:hypothetical protein